LGFNAALTKEKSAELERWIDEEHDVNVSREEAAWHLLTSATMM
jgi:hypothetical protein